MADPKKKVNPKHIVSKKGFEIATGKKISSGEWSRFKKGKGGVYANMSKEYEYYEKNKSKRVDKAKDAPKKKSESSAKKSTLSFGCLLYTSPSPRD